MSHKCSLLYTELKLKPERRKVDTVAQNYAPGWKLKKNSSSLKYFPGVENQLFAEQ